MTHECTVNCAQAILAAQEPVLLFFNGIGDHLISLPAIRALAHLFSGRLRLICHRDAPELFFSDVPLKHCVRISHFWRSAGEVAFDADAVASAVGECDVLLSLNRSFTASVQRLLEVMKPQLSLGYFRPFSASLPLRHDIHAADVAFELPQLLCPDLDLLAFAQPPVLPRAAERAALDLYRHLPSGMRVLCVHVESGAGKGWALQPLIDFCRAFLGRHSEYSVLIVGTNNVAISKDVSEGLVVDATGLPLAVSLAVVSQSDLFTGVDSCMLHAADSFRVPGVGLFGPTRSAEFGFRFSDHRHVSSCSGMTLLSPEAVLDAIEELIAARSERYESLRGVSTFC